MINNVVLRVTNGSGSIYDFQPQSNIDLKVDISAIENTEIGNLFGIATQEFSIINGEDCKISEFFGNLQYAGAVSNNDLTQYYPCQVLNAGNLVFEGQMYLRSVITDNQGYVQYNVGIVNDNITLSKQLEALTLSNLNWNAYNHTFNYNSITGSWDNQIANGAIKYPHVNYGMNQADSTCPQYAFSAWNIATANTFDTFRKPLRIWDFKPAIRAKDVVDTIFSGSSFEYTSSFFNSSYFNNLYILPSANNNLGANPANAVSQSIWAYASSSQNTGILPGTEQQINYDTFYYQNGSGFNLATDRYTAATAGNYNVSANVVFFVGNWSPYISGIQPQVDFLCYKNGGITPVLSNRQYQPPPTSSIDISGTLNLNAGDYLEFYLKFTDSAISTKFLDTANAVNYNPIGAPTNENGVYTTYVKISTNALADNFNVNMGYQFPADMTCWDIMKGLSEKFNLVIEPLPGTKTFKIEPYQNWIDEGTQIDWSNKVDIGTKFQLSHPAIEQPKTIIFSDEEDNDFYNVDAKEKNRFGYTYGTYVFNFDGDIAQNSERRIGKTFAATPVSAIPNSTQFIIPHLCEISDNSTTTPIQYKPRLLYDNGKKLTPTDALGVDSNLTINRGKYYFRDNNTGLAVSQSYWYQMTPLTTVPTNFTSGQDLHFNNLNWQPYIQLYSNGRTAKDAYSEYWGSYINTLYDEDARKLKCNVYLTPLDIANIRLNNKYFIMGNYWRVNKIANANLNRPQNTEVELIKVPVRITKYPARRTYIRGLDLIPATDASIRISQLNANGTVSYENAETGTPVTSFRPISVAGPKDNLIVSQNGANAVAVWNYQEQTTPQSANQQQTILGVNNVNAIASRVSVVGSENEVSGTTDSIDLTGDRNTIGETNTNITIISSNDNTIDAQNQTNIIIEGGEGNIIKSDQIISSPGADIPTNNIILLNVSGSTITNTEKSNFIGRFTQNTNTLGTLYNNLAQGYDYYGMNVMASTGLEEAYWFNTRPLYINSIGNTTYNMNTTEARNRYAVYINKSGAAGITDINLDDIDGVSGNFPQRGRSIIFYTDANCSPASPVKINRGGSDVFLPSFSGNGLNITLDEPWQVCEIHGNYNPNDGATWWQVIRRTTEQRRNSYGHYVMSTAYETSADECYNPLFDITLKEYGVVCDNSVPANGSKIYVPYAGMWKFTYTIHFYFDITTKNSVGLSISKNGVIIPASTVFEIYHNKESNHSLVNTYLVDIGNPTSEYIQSNIYSFDPITLIPSTSDCRSAYPATIECYYVGGGYGIDYTL